MSKKKEYVVGLSFGNEDIYFLKEEGDEILELYNPEEATVFSASATALKFARERTAMGEYAKSYTVEAARKHWQDFISPKKVRRRLPAVQPSFSRKYDPQKDTREEVLRMHIEMHKHDRFVRYEDYQTWPRLYALFKYIFEKAAYADPENHNADVFTFSMALPPTDDNSFVLRYFKDELRLVLKYATYKNEDGYTVIPIFDYKLSEHGDSCHFFYKSDDDCFIKGRYDSFTPVSPKNQLKECIEFWRRRRYYN